MGIHKLQNVGGIKIYQICYFIGDALVWEASNYPRKAGITCIQVPDLKETK
jgi:hypothetical protein